MSIFGTKKHANTVLCIGSMGKDIFMPTDAGVTGESSPGIKTQKQWAFGLGAKLHVENRFYAPGGCACNISVGLARLGGESQAYGIVGDDTDGSWISNTLEQEGVVIGTVQQEKDRASDLAMILVHAQSGERTIFVNRDVGEDLCLVSKNLAQAPWIFVGSLYGETVRDNMRTIHNAVAGTKTKLIYNPGMRNITKQPRTVWDLVHHTSLLFVNETEAKELICQIVQKDDSQYNNKDREKMSPEELLQTLLAQTGSQGVVVMTCGKGGAYLATGDNILHVGTMPQDIVDTTGAGDAFASGFVAAYCLQRDIEVCLRWGAANSHSVIAHYGAHKGLLRKSVIETEQEYFTVTKKKY